MAQPGNGGRTVEDIAHECGITRQTMYKWRGQSNFQAELERQIALNTLNTLPEAIETLLADTPNGKDTIVAAKGLANGLTKLIDSLREEPEYIDY
jgi:transposase-like protein